MAEVTISLPRQIGVLAMPSAAVSRKGNEKGVWQMLNGRAHFTPVKIGSQGQADLVQIFSGVSEGDSVIVYSSAQLEEGVRVRQERVEP